METSLFWVAQSSALQTRKVVASITVKTPQTQTDESAVPGTHLDRFRAAIPPPTSRTWCAMSSKVVQGLESIVNGSHPSAA